MRTRLLSGHLSIRLRLLLAGTVGMALSLVLAAWGLAILFDRHITRVAVSDLNDRLEHLASAVEITPSRAPVMPVLASDPLYQRPYSGRYWQIEMPGTELRSRSLWDYALPLPPDTSAAWQGALQGPQGEALIVVLRDMTIADPAGDQPLRIAVAISRAQVDAARSGFLADLVPYLALLGLILFAALAAAITIALRPLSAIGGRVAAVAAGKKRRVGRDVPFEMLPLATEIDALLHAREADVTRARLRAGDMAHGLKTPLQALMGEASRLRMTGASETARGIESIAGTMRRHVDREIARARFAGERAPVSCDPAEVADAVAGVLRRTPKGAELQIAVASDAGLSVRLDRSDLAEALGALAENAVRYAQSRVQIHCFAENGDILVQVRDDGSGIDPTMLDMLPGRGLRLDQRDGGSGLGLSIASDIAIAADGTLHLRNLDPGFEAELQLPSSALRTGRLSQNSLNR